MSNLRIVKLSESGLHDSEVDALEKISKCLPPSWLAYSNFEFRDKKIGNREIDLVLVTQDAILLVELKNWNGKLRSEGTHWILNGQDRGESPVAITNRKSQYLKTLIFNKEKHNVRSVYVAPIVVLCGSASPKNLSEEDKGFVCSLDDFCKIKSPNWFKKLFPSVRSRSSPLNKEKEVFNRIFSTKVFDPRKLRYQGYVPEGRPIFSHRDNLYQEFIAEQDNKPRFRALLRTWDLQQLPPAYGTRERWKEVIDREKSVVGYVKEVLPRDFVARTMLTPVGNTPEEEFSSKYFELYDLPPRQEMIDVYLYRHSERLSVQQRLQLASIILSAFSEFHQENLAHRDISSTCIWTGDDFSISISRWLAAAYPEGQTVGPVRDFLRSGRSATPEDKLDEPSDAFRRDVFLLGALVYFLVTSKHPPLNDGVAEFDGLPDGLLPENIAGSLATSLEKALSWEPSNRYSNAMEFCDALQAVVDTEEPAGPRFLEELSAFLTDKYPYVDYPIRREYARSHVHVYESIADDHAVIVKVWPGLKVTDNDSGSNHRLLQFLGAARDLSRVRPFVVQEIIDYGISDVGTFLVSKIIAGTSVSELIQSKALNLEAQLRLSKKMLDALNVLHSMEIVHGDIKPENVFVLPCRDGEGDCIRFIDCPDLDIDGQFKETPAYSVSAPELSDRYVKDRHAMLMTVSEILGAEVTITAGNVSVSFDAVELGGLEEELNHRFSEAAELLALDTVESHVDAVLARVTRGELMRLEIPLRNLQSRTPLMPDDEQYRVHIDFAPNNLVSKLNLEVETNRYFQLQIAGVNGVFRVIWDEVKKTVVTGDLIQDPTWRLVGRPAAEIRAFLVFLPAAQSDFSIFGRTLADTLSGIVQSFITKAKTVPPASDVVTQPARAEALSGEEANEVGRADIEELWHALIEAEADVLPELTVSDEPDYVRGNPRRIIVPYESKNGQPIEFDRAEVVTVEKKGSSGQYTKIGTLVGDLVSSDLIGIDLTKGFPPSVNDTIRLNSALAKASYDKRRIAIDRLTSGQSIHPELFDWLTGMSAPSEGVPESNVEENDEISRRFRLNESQCRAIRKVLNIPPLGLVQGPPGTGKTYFIAVLIYRLLYGGANNVLLTSQSHEAVNNVIDKLSIIYSDDLDKLDLARVGPLSMCSEESARFHIDNIQHRYRKSFESDVRNRIEFSARNLGLPPQFISQYVRLSVATRSLLEDFDSRRAEIESEESDTERINKELSSIRKSIYGRARRISVKLSEFERIQDPIQGVAQMKQHLVSVHDITNDAAVSRLEDLIGLAFDWIHALISPHGNFGEFLTRTKRIVCGTCVGVGRRGLNITKHAHEWVIIDEAARCSAGEIAVPAQTAQRLVLVGDHKQLPPMYTPEVVDAAAMRLEPRLKQKVHESDFRRAVESKYGLFAAQLLHEQYRMKPAIAQMVSDIFYDGQLKTIKDDVLIADRSMPSPFDADVIWCDTAPLGRAALEKRETLAGGGEGPSFVNLGEVRKILELLKMLESERKFVDVAKDVSRQGDKPIGIICTYAGQKRELLRQLRQRNFSDDFYDLIKVDTVDSYQGKENLVIILSLVRNNSKKQVGFLGRDERVNVAVSRAMERLVIVGSSEMWGSLNAPPSRVYEYIRKRCDTDKSYSIVDQLVTR